MEDAQKESTGTNWSEQNLKTSEYIYSQFLRDVI